MELPIWAKKYKTKGHEVKCISGRYYLYKISSKWDPVKKRPVKHIDEYLGVIAEDGFRPKKLSHPARMNVCTREFGLSSYILSLSKDIRATLLSVYSGYPDSVAETIYVLMLMRVIGVTAFKRMEQQYETSYISEVIPSLNVESSYLTKFIKDIGTGRDLIESVMDKLSSYKSHLLIDGTLLTSNSKNIKLAEVGYNAIRSWQPQVNIMYIFAKAKNPEPVFYRCVGGNIPDVKAMKLTIEAFKRENTVIVGDTGTGSDENFELLTSFNLEYIIPLKRNTCEIKLNDGHEFTNAFKFEKRLIQSYEVQKSGYKIVVFRDDQLRLKERADLTNRVYKRNEKIEHSRQKSPKTLLNLNDELKKLDSKFGIIIMRTNVDYSHKEIYETYKMRGEIEQFFDMLKNTLHMDHSNMQNDASFECWCFINHLASIVIYRIFRILKEKNLSSEYSIQDIREYLNKIFKVKIGDKWVMSEMTKKCLTLCTKLGLPLE